MIFNIIEGSIVILGMNGLYAKRGNSFVRLCIKHATSAMKLYYEEIILPEEFTKISNKFGGYNVVSTAWYNRGMKSKLKKTTKLKRVPKGKRKKP